MTAIDDLSAEQSRALLHEIADLFQIGPNARNADVLVQNVRNAARQEFRLQPPDTRVVELAERLVAPGPKCCAVSASECHELRNYIAEAARLAAHADSE